MSWALLQDMPDSIDFYKDIFLHVIRGRIIVLWWKYGASHYKFGKLLHCGILRP